MSCFVRSVAAGGAERNNKKLHDDVTVAPVMYGNSEAAAASASDAAAPLRLDKVKRGGGGNGAKVLPRGAFSLFSCTAEQSTVSEKVLHIIFRQQALLVIIIYNIFSESFPPLKKKCNKSYKRRFNPYKFKFKTTKDHNILNWNCFELNMKLNHVTCKFQTF